MSPTNPDTFYGQAKLDAEQVVLNARRADGAQLGTVLRFGANLVPVLKAIINAF